MSIVTKTGDKGATALMYGRRVPKSHPRIEACGAVDELNSALGVARAAASQEIVRAGLPGIQKDLVALMGELAVENGDAKRYAADGFSALTSEATSKLDRLVAQIEAEGVSTEGWATPGANPAAAALDLARSVCRRAERRVCRLQESGELPNAEIIVYLNRLSDLLWLLARRAESR